jgi:hypothetical protein
VIAPAWNQTIGPVSRRVLGHNTVWSRGGLGLWDEQARAPDPEVVRLVRALAPGVLRFPGGTRAMRYHFAGTLGPPERRAPQCDTFTGALDATGYGLDEFLRLAGALGAEVGLVSPWNDGTPEEVGAMVAYANAELGSTAIIGVDRNGVDWGTAADWAARRQGAGHPEPYRAGFLEIGNEQYLGIPVGPERSCGRDRQFRQNERWVDGRPVPTTAADYAAEIALTAAVVRRVDPGIAIGVAAMSEFGRDDDAATAVALHDQESGAPWNPTLLERAGDAFDFFALHPYDFTTRTGARLALAERTRQVVHGLRALAPDKAIALTEYGTLFDAGTLLNALITADLVRVAVEEQLVMALRHILIEDDARGPFAESAAILGADHRLTPGYHAVRMLAETLAEVAVPVATGAGDLEALATRSAAGDRLGIVVIAKRRQGDPSTLELALPDGRWTGTVTTLSGASVTARDIELATREVAGSGAIAATVPPLAVVAIALSRG